MDPALASMLTALVTQYRFTGHDGYQPTFGIALERPARIEARTRLTMTPQGPAEQSQTTVYLLPDQPIAMADKLVLPDGTSPAISNVRAVLDEAGNLDHWEVIL